MSNLPQTDTCVQFNRKKLLEKLKEMQNKSPSFKSIFKRLEIAIKVSKFYY